MTTAILRKNTQKQLPLRVDVVAPMVSLAAARDITGLTVDVLQALVEEHKIAWAWDIGLGSKRKEVRLLTRCVRGIQVTGDTCNLAGEPWANIFRAIASRAGSKPYLTTRQLCFAFACEPDLVMDLIAQRQIATLPETEIRRGRNGQALITLESINQFLTSRRL